MTHQEWLEQDYESREPEKLKYVLNWVQICREWLITGWPFCMSNAMVKNHAACRFWLLRVGFLQTRTFTIPDIWRNNRIKGLKEERYFCKWALSNSKIGHTVQYIVSMWQQCSVSFHILLVHVLQPFTVADVMMDPWVKLSKWTIFLVHCVAWNSIPDRHRSSLTVVEKAFRSFI